MHLIDLTVDIATHPEWLQNNILHNSPNSDLAYIHNYAQLSTVNLETFVVKIFS